MDTIFNSSDKYLKNENDPLLDDKKLKSKRKQYVLRYLCIFLTFILLMLIFIVLLTFNKSVEKKSPILLKSIATINSDYFDKCATPVTCNPNAKYRTINGSCNNFKNPNWGTAMTPFYRYVDPEFSDGISKFRLQSDGSPLPNARRVTLIVFKNVHDFCSHKNNELLVPWSQFVAHDMAYSALNSINSTFPTALDHCHEENPPIECDVTIKLYPNDPAYGKYNVTLLKFMRLVTSANYSCPLIPATVLNQNTHYIDASNVYGSDVKLANQLRTFNGGKLRFNEIGNQMYCPQDPTKTLINGKQTGVAFLAGDGNVNQNLGIALFQNLFLRFHNYIARELNDKDYSWTDEIVYQETRRIVAAVVQVITYDHFLPIILGDQYMDKFELTNKTNYDPTITAAIAQEMTSGAFRLLHTMIPAQFNYMSSNNTIYEVEEPSKSFLRPDSLIGNDDGFLRGLMETYGREPTPSYNKLITNIVVQSPYINTTGFDLLSYDIQRGRDVGLPPYVKMRKFCGLSEVKSFDDLKDHIPLEKIELLKTLYSTVEDIDYYVGILLENKINGSMFGPTGSYVIADSFYRTRNGDRFFYDVIGQPGSFTSDQINTLKKLTLSHLICATSHLDHVRKDTFSLNDNLRKLNPMANCNTYKIDLTAW